MEWRFRHLDYRAQSGNDIRYQSSVSFSLSCNIPGCWLKSVNSSKTLSVCIWNFQLSKATYTWTDKRFTHLVICLYSTRFGGLWFLLRKNLTKESAWFTFIHPWNVCREIEWKTLWQKIPLVSKLRDFHSCNLALTSQPLRRTSCVGNYDTRKCFKLDLRLFAFREVCILHELNFLWCSCFHLDPGINSAELKNQAFHLRHCKETREETALLKCGTINGLKLVLQREYTLSIHLVTLQRNCWFW